MSEMDKMESYPPKLNQIEQKIDKNWLTPEKANQNMIENEQKVNKIRQNIEETRWKGTKSTKKRQKADQKQYACPTIVFWAKLSKEFDFQVFRNFGEIVWDKLLNISIFWSDIISLAQLDIWANFYRNG